MRARGLLTVAAVLSIGAGIVCFAGCDDDHHHTVLLETKPATKPSKPTTQELLNGEQKPVALSIIPFTIKAPAGWKIRPDQGLVMLEGPTPSGVAQIQISRHISPIAEHAQLLIEGAKRDAAAHPGPLVRAEIKTIRAVKVLETRSVGSTSHIPTIDAAGTTIAPTSTPINWKISAFVPHGRDTDVCEIHFVELSKEQYDIDKDLLERMIASLEYDEKAESN